MAAEVMEPRIVVRGDVPSESVGYGRDKLRAVAGATARPILDLELRLSRDGDPARERPCHAELAIDVDGARVLAHGEARTMHAAIDEAIDRLQRRLDQTLERSRSRLRRLRDDRSWHHGDAAPGATPAT